MTARHHVDAVLADDRALDRLALRRPVTSADPVLALLGAWAADADPAADADAATDRVVVRTPGGASVTALPLGDRRRSRGRRRVTGLVTMAALVVGSGGVAAALTGEPLAALSGLRAAIVDVIEAPDAPPGHVSARSGSARGGSHDPAAPSAVGGTASLGAWSLDRIATGGPSAPEETTQARRSTVTRPVETGSDSQHAGGRVAPDAGQPMPAPAPAREAPDRTPPAQGGPGGPAPGGPVADGPEATPGARHGEPGAHAEPDAPSVRRAEPGQGGQPGSDGHGSSGDGGSGVQPPPPARPDPGPGAPGGGQPDAGGVVQPAPAKVPAGGVQLPEPPGATTSTPPPPPVPAVVTEPAPTPDVAVDG